MPFMTYNPPNLIEQSVTQAAYESLVLQHSNSSNLKNKRSKSFATSKQIINVNNDEKSPSPSPPQLIKEKKQKKNNNKQLRYNKSRSSASFTQIPGPLPPHHKKQRDSQRRKRIPSQPVPHNHSQHTKSQNNSPRYHQHHQQQRPQHHNGYSNNFLSYSKSVNNSPKNGGNFIQNGRSKSFKYSNNNNNNNNHNVQKRNSSVQRRNKGSNYLEAVVVIKIVETKIYKLIEIITENDFKIRCTATHLFWICGKGWGCFDSKSRIFLEKQIAILNKQKRKSNNKKVKIPHNIYELQKGEQLLTVGGNKYRIAAINIIEKPKGINVFSIIVNKNDCFFANDLLVKNSIS